jgi:hypothetical protein
VEVFLKRLRRASASASASASANTDFRWFWCCLWEMALDYNPDCQDPLLEFLKI